MSGTMEAEVRDYLRTDSALMGLLNDEAARVNMDWTGNAKATHVTLYRAGGDVDGYYPYDRPVIVIHIYGSTRPAAAEVAGEVVRAMRDIDPRHTPLLDASVESTVYLPTTEGAARYVVTTSVTARFGPVPA